MRCFLAVPLDEPALGDAQQVLASLRDRIPAVRWVRSETLHMTVHFFGSLGDERVLAALKAVRPIADEMPRFDVGLDTLGAFPSQGRPRVLWLGSTAQPVAFTTFATGCRGALSRAGFEVDDRPFRVHCTLGRPRIPWTPSSRDAWRAALGEPVAVRGFSAQRLVLYESISARGGNMHVERASFPLRERDAAAAAR